MQPYLSQIQMRHHDFVFKGILCVADPSHFSAGVVHDTCVQPTDQWRGPLSTNNCLLHLQMLSEASVEAECFRSLGAQSRGCPWTKGRGDPLKDVPSHWNRVEWLQQLCKPSPSKAPTGYQRHDIHDSCHSSLSHHLPCLPPAPLPPPQRPILQEPPSPVRGRGTIMVRWPPPPTARLVRVSFWGSGISRSVTLRVCTIHGENEPWRLEDGAIKAQ